MSKNDAASLYNGLVEVKNLKNKAFALKTAKNMIIIKEALEHIEELGKPSEEFMKISMQVQELMNTNSEEGKEKIAELEKDNAELIEKRKEQMEEVNTRLLEDIELNLNKFSEKMLPEEITADQILKLTKIIEE